MKFTLRTPLMPLLMLTVAAAAAGADFGGKKYYINPGHGGHDSDDRPTPLPLGVEIFYESDGNLSRGLHLRDFLTTNGAQVKMSRVTNTTADDLSLSTIAAQANSYGGYFISLHTNGANASANYVLGLYRTSADAPSAETVSGSKSMVQTAVNQLSADHLTDFTAGSRVSGDYAFYGYNLGVLRTNNRPGYLIESTFHDYRPDGLRLKSEVFNRFTAWQLARAALDNSGGAPGGTGTLPGCIIGDVRDLTQPCGYTDYVSRGRDRYLAVNGAVVNLYDDKGKMVHTMTTDNCCNGIYGFFDLPEGSYTIETARKGYRTQRHVVTVADNAVTRQLIDLVPGEATLELLPRWRFSENNGEKPQWLTDGWVTLRNMCYGNGKLYITAPSVGKVYVVDARTGTLLSMLDMTGVSGGTFALMDVRFVDDKIVGCNLAVKADEPLKVYVWDNDNAQPRCIMSTTSRGNIARLGDTFDVAGSLTDGSLLFVSSGDSANGSYLVKYPLTDGESDGTPQLHEVTAASGAPVKLGISPRVISASDGNLWLTGQSIAPSLADADARIVSTVNAAALDNVTLGNDFAPFTFDGRQYGVASTYTPAAEASSGKSLTGGKLALIDGETGWNDSELLALYPEQGLGTTPNDTFSTAVCVNTDGKEWVETWLLVTRQGLASYTYGDIPGTTDVDSILADDGFGITAEIYPDHISVNSDRPVAHAAVYDITGSLLAQNDGNRLNIALAPGIYIIVALDLNNRTATAKIRY